MKTGESNNLKFRRQYIITPKEIECPFLCNTFNLNRNYILYAHKDLIVTEHVKNNTKIILLGDMFDYEPQIKSNSDILEEIIETSFDKIIEKSDKYMGRYVIIFQQDEELKLFHDTTASRKIYYANVEESLWFASQPYLLGRILDLKETILPSKVEYYNSQDFILGDCANIGDTTLYDEIHQVLPNHFFNVNQAKAIRFFPNKPLEHIPVKEAEKKCAEIVKGYIENIVARYDVMLPVTAGKDSRLLLAATKNVKNKVYYYINKGNRLSESSKDISIPKSLMKKLGLDFHVINQDMPIDEEFKSMFFINNNKPAIKYLPPIYNYYVNHATRVNLPGNIAFEPFYIRKFPYAEITPSSIANIMNFQKYDFAKEYYASWLSDVRGLCERTNLHILNLLYWEERLGNWSTQIQIDKDIAQEEFNPFNSRLLTCLFLSIDYRLLSPPYYTFHKETIKYLWPEVLQEPINPGFKDDFKKILKFFGIFNTVYRIKSFFLFELKKR